MNRHLFRGALLAVSLILGLSLFAAACGSSDSATRADPDVSSAESASIVMSGLVDYPMTFVTLDTDYAVWVTVTDGNSFDLIMPGMDREAWVDDVVMMEFN